MSIHFRREIDWSQHASLNIHHLRSWEACDVFLQISVSLHWHFITVLNHSCNWMHLLRAWVWWGFTSPALVEALTQFYGKSNVGLQQKLLGANHSHLRGAQNQKTAAAQCNHLLNRSPLRPTHHIHSHWWLCGRRVAACKRQQKKTFFILFSENVWSTA